MLDCCLSVYRSNLYSQRRHMNRRVHSHLWVHEWQNAKDCGDLSRTLPSSLTRYPEEWGYLSKHRIRKKKLRLNLDSYYPDENGIIRSLVIYEFRSAQNSKQSVSHATKHHVHTPRTRTTGRAASAWKLPMFSGKETLHMMVSFMESHRQSSTACHLQGWLMQGILPFFTLLRKTHPLWQEALGTPLGKHGVWAPIRLLALALWN